MAALGGLGRETRHEPATGPPRSSRGAMDWGDVRVFLAVAREGSMRAAGRALGLSQPTIARRLAAFETSFGGQTLQCCRARAETSREPAKAHPSSRERGPEGYQASPQRNLPLHRQCRPRTPAAAPAGARRNGLFLRIGERGGLPQRIQDAGRQRPQRRAAKPQ